jgi:hypothetical protein
VSLALFASANVSVPLICMVAASLAYLRHVPYVLAGNQGRPASPSRPARIFRWPS